MYKDKEKEERYQGWKHQLKKMLAGLDEHLAELAEFEKRYDEEETPCKRASR